LIEQAQQHYENAQQYLQEGNFAGFGEEWTNLQEVLEELAQLTPPSP
ncbi:MAG: hypothetical protein GX631_00235, partial [Dehalococcoidales bacterium]|nr:hypothetical protein [Dehalococcoidales bacterium]